MNFITMDLIGEFHPPSSRGNQYALTGICMLTGFTWCIPLKSKKASEVSRAYLQHVYSVLGGSTKILTDNGTEFKNEVFKEMLQKLGTEKIDSFTTIQTTIQWKNRRISLLSQSLHS